MYAAPPYLPHPARRRSRASRPEKLSNSLAVLALLAGGIVWGPALERPAHGAPHAASAVAGAPHPAV
jgi:hypothetical protein